MSGEEKALSKDLDGCAGENVRIPAGDVLLDGELTIPEDSEGVVVFAHGSGSSRFSPRNRFVAGVMQDFGLGTLLFDLLSPAEGSVARYTRHLRFDIELLAGRLTAATTWLLAEKVAAGTKVGLFGASTGAAAALVAAAELGERVAAVVSRGGRPDLAGQSLVNVTVPVLLIVGELDTEVIQLNRQAFELLSGTKQIDIVRGASHLFEEPGTLEEAANLAARWFREHLR